MSNILLENSSPQLVVIREQEIVHGLPIIKLRGKCQEAEAQNKNGRLYKLETLQEKIIGERATSEKLLANPLFGEKIHPDDELTGEIDPEKIIWKINELVLDGNVMMGEFQLIPEAPVGKVMYHLVDKYGAVPGVSSRAYGSMTGKYVDHDSYQFVTFDGTFNPSTHGSFLNSVKEAEEIKTILKECDKPQLELLNETFEFTADKVFVDFITESKIKKKMPENLNENQQVLVEKVTTLSEDLGKKSGEIATLTKTVETHEATIQTKDDEIKSVKESLGETEGYFDKSVKVIAGMKEALTTVTNEKAVLEANYEKSLEVIKGLQEQYSQVKFFYEKSISVLEEMFGKNVQTQIKEYVDSELGEGSFEELKESFEGIEDLNAIKGVVSVVKKKFGTDGPASAKLRENHDKGKGGKGNAGPAQPADALHESRVEMYKNTDPTNVDF